MTHTPGPQGYTIIEVMIFLAISSAMFFSAWIAIGSQHKRVQFGQATRSFDARLSDIINDVSSGFSPNDGSFACTAGPTLTTSPNTAQGENSDCVFLGKAVQFSVNGKPEATSVYTVVGNHKVAATGAEATTLNDANPTVVKSPIVGVPTIDITSRENNRWGLKVDSIVDPASGQHFGSLVFLSGLGNYDANGALNSGKQDVIFAGVPNTTLAQDETAAVPSINAVTDAVGSPGKLNVNPPQGIVLCVSDYYGQSATVTIKPGVLPTTELKLDDGVCPP